MSFWSIFSNEIQADEVEEEGNDNDWTCRYCGTEYTAAQNKGDCDHCNAGFEDQGGGRHYNNNSGEFGDENSESDYISEEVEADPEGNKFW